MTENVLGFIKTIVCDNIIAPNLIVKVTSTGCDVSTAATDAIMGVCVNPQATAAGDAASIQILGTTKVVASGAISKGAWVTATTGGKAIATTSDHAVVLGRALSASVNSGDIIEVQLGVFTLSA